MKQLSATTQDQCDKAPSSAYASLNSKFKPDTVTACPCCQQMALEVAFQPPLIPTKAGYELMHCKNPDCTGYGMTMKREAFLTAMAATKGNE
jgi:hypothetical protein